MGLKIACHQPNFFPHPGFFRKLLMSDVFVLLDDVQFARRSYTQRTLIKLHNMAAWLTVPVIKKGRYYQLVKDVEIDNSRPWRRDHLRTFVHHYKQSAYFEEVYSMLEAVYSGNEALLMDFNINALKEVLQFLNIQKKFILSSSLGVNAKGSERILQIVKKLGGNAYISGEGGKRYLDMDGFRESGIDVVFYEYPGKYRQLGFGFIKGLSILDLLFNEGKKGRRVIEP